MLFTIQTYLEDYLRRRNIIDTDGYAVRLANIYFHHRALMEAGRFLQRIKRVRTVMFTNNAIDNRSDFERVLIDTLDKRFKKKLPSDNPSFPGGLERESKILQHLSRRSVDIVLQEFKTAVEARAIDAFWHSRKKGILSPKPEKIAQSLFAVFVRGVLRNRGVILREISSGIGFIDIGVLFSSTLHLIEMKILTKHLTGADQLKHYMKTENRKRGYLLIIDAMKPEKKLELPSFIETPEGKIKVYSVDINPIPPSSAK